ncbi:hypothetical protein ACOSQ4_022778 [Xanthoceras sorbifolium]
MTTKKQRRDFSEEDAQGGVKSKQGISKPNQVHNSCPDEEDCREWEGKGPSGILDLGSVRRRESVAVEENSVVVPNSVSSGKEDAISVEGIPNECPLGVVETTRVSDRDTIVVSLVEVPVEEVAVNEGAILAFHGFERVPNQQTPVAEVAVVAEVVSSNVMGSTSQLGPISLDPEEVQSPSRPMGRKWKRAARGGPNSMAIDGQRYPVRRKSPVRHHSPAIKFGKSPSPLSPVIKRRLALSPPYSDEIGSKRKKVVFSDDARDGKKGRWEMVTMPLILFVLCCGASGVRETLSFIKAAAG